MSEPAFQTVIVRPFSASLFPEGWPSLPRDSRPKSGGKTKNEAVGGDGSLVFKDCDGETLASISWVRGQIQQDGAQIVEVGSCEGGGTSSTPP